MSEHPGGTRDAGELAVAFSRVLRGAGMTVPTSATIAFGTALVLTGLTDRDATYWAGAATLLTRPEDRPIYDRAFRAFWEHAEPVDDEPTEPTAPVTIIVDHDEAAAGGETDPATPSTDPTIELRFSRREVLRHKNFSEFTPAELDESLALMSRLRVAGTTRRSRRLTPTNRRTPRPDLRRTVRAALGSDGEPLRRYFRTRASRHRRLVLLLDVSGSMEPYARALIRFVHAAVAGRQKVEAFTLGTRLTRITRELSHHHPDEALRRAADEVADFGGGTRLGEGLGSFNDRWGQRGTARGAIVVILSDGWDRGDPEHLAEQMQRLKRVAYRVIWVNPLKVTPGYAPLARGMAAALPYIDSFVEGHSIDALEGLAAEIATDHRAAASAGSR